MAIAIVVIIVGVLGSAFISASEAALISVNKVRMRRLAEEGNIRARAAVRVTQEHEKFFGTILLTGNVLNVMITAVATSLAITIVGQNNVGVVAAATALAAIIIVIGGELTPKSVAATASERWSLISARPILLLMSLTAPLVWFFAAFPRFVVFLMGGKQALMTPTVTEGELRMLIDVGEEEGTVAATRGEMLESVFRFGEMQVADVMSPRNEIVWVEAGTSVSDFLDIYQSTQHTRFPVFEDDEDEVIGVLSIKDVLRSLSENPGELNRPVTTLTRSAMFVPEASDLSDLFTTLQTGGHKMALVVDEYGGIAGLVTLARVLEQVVGRTGEEGRSPSERIFSIGENTFELDGAMSIDEANDRLELEIPDGDYNTIAGFVLDNIQRMPEAGHRFRYGDLNFRITAVDGNKILRVHVRVPVQIEAGERRPV